MESDCGQKDAQTTKRRANSAGGAHLVLLPLDAMPHDGDVGQELLANRLFDSATIGHIN